MRGNAAVRRVQCPGCASKLTVIDSTAANIRCATCKLVFPAAAAIPIEGPKPGVSAGVCVLAAIGFVMSLQPVSLMTGTTAPWLGVAIIGAGVAVSFFLRAHLWVRIVACLLLAVALFNVLMVEQEMSERREQISRTLRN